MRRSARRVTVDASRRRTYTPIQSRSVIPAPRSGRRPTTDVLKVASHSNPNSVSGAIVAGLSRNGVVELHAIGAGAVNQAVKAIAIARRAIEKPGDPPLKVVPGFIDVTVEGESRTGVRLIVER